MKLIKILTLDNVASRESEIFLISSGRFEVFNMINGEQLSYSFPAKSYKTIKAAKKYANKFLEA